ncbi:hypothetical protein [Aquimarina pacifica]|uniref:hypothetical protein n=1 Tax=Aquimarina pacifica TaxID=1296415 RepID=UPI0004726101|nr:hypothetical protein [Aquimarina pacifica]
MYRNTILILLVFFFLESFAQNKIEVFWKEFETNETEISKLKTEEQLVRLNKMVKKISPGLLIEFFNNQVEQDNLVISADGNKTLFSLVHQIVDSSIDSEFFNFIALRQETPGYHGFKIEGKELLIEEMTFIPQEMDYGLFVIFVFSNKSNTIDRGFLENYGMNTIDYLIGEKKFSEDIDDFEFIFTKDLDVINMKNEKSFPLSELSSYLTKRKEPKIKSDLELLITSGKWNIDYMELGDKKRSTDGNKDWMIFYENGKCEILTNGKKSNEKWFLQEDILNISIFRSPKNFKIKQTNDQKITLYTLMNGSPLIISLKKDKE